MGQIEVYELLHDLRKSGDDNFYSQREIQDKLREKGHTNGLIRGVWGDLRCLERWGYLDAKMSGKWRDWNRLYRIKGRYVKKE